jgi:hypothetical protein
VVLKLEELVRARYNVLTAASLKIQTLWEVTLFRWVSGPRGFDGLWYLRLPGLAVYCPLVLDPDEAPATGRRMSEDVSIGSYVVICTFCVVVLKGSK